jgi:hypothetical protein
MPANSSDIAQISACVYLSQNRGFLIYETSSQLTKATIIRIDTENGVYECIGRSETYKEGGCTCCDFILREFTVVVKTFYIENNIRIFEIDPLTFKIKSHRTITAPQNSCLFGLMDGDLVFVNVLSYTGFSQNIGNFLLVKNENKFMVIKNTDVKVDVPMPLDRPEWVSSVLKPVKVMVKMYENKILKILWSPNKF